MSELERIKNIEERIALAGLLPGVNMGWLPPGEAAKLKRAVLELYRIGHANGFRAGVDHATNALAVIPPRRDSLQTQWPMRWLSARMRERWQEFKKSLRSIRVAIIISPRGRRVPTEAFERRFGDPPVRPWNQQHAVSESLDADRDEHGRRGMQRSQQRDQAAVAFRL